MKHERLGSNHTKQTKKGPNLLLGSWSITWTVLDDILRLSSVFLHSEEAKQVQEQDIN